jgi:hypothetical protein
MNEIGPPSVLEVASRCRVVTRSTVLPRIASDCLVPPILAIGNSCLWQVFRPSDVNNTSRNNGLWQAENSPKRGQKKCETQATASPWVRLGNRNSRPSSLILTPMGPALSHIAWQAPCTTFEERKPTPFSQYLSVFIQIIPDTKSRHPGNKQLNDPRLCLGSSNFCNSVDFRVDRSCQF